MIACASIFNNTNSYESKKKRRKPNINFDENSDKLLASNYSSSFV